VDVLAITLLLAGVGILTQARQSNVIRNQSARLAAFTQRQFLPALNKPPVSKLCLTRD
jgi:hypothetical protein